MMIRDLTLPVAAAMLALTAPAVAQELPDEPGAPAVAADDGDLVEPRAREAPALFGAETEGYAAEDFYWMNRESDRWPRDLDPRDNDYLPSPEPNLTFELDLGL